MIFAAINIGELEVASLVGLMTVMVTALGLRQQQRKTYVDDLESWVKELREQNAVFVAKNKAQDRAIARLEEAVDRCEQQRHKEAADHQQQLFNLWAEIRKLKGDA